MNDPATHVRASAPSADTPPVEAARQVVDTYLPGPARLEAARILVRIAKRHVEGGERILWAGLLTNYTERGKEELIWLILTTSRLFVARRRTGDPAAYPVAAVRINPMHQVECGGPLGDTLWSTNINGEGYGDYNGVVWRESRSFQIFLAALRAAQEGTLTVAPNEPKPNTTDRGARPELRLIRTARDAELVVVEWMRWFGYVDARPTPIGKDSGIDVEASVAVAQVKMEGVPSGRPYVQALFGVASAEGKQGVFFSLAGYTAEAIAWASRLKLPLFTFDLQGEPKPVNAVASALMAQSEGTVYRDA
jgi:hypothetical protein